MNTVGKAGSFIIKYQMQIELVLVLILAAAAVFFLVRAIINAGRKRQLLSQINDTVTEINTAVTSLSEKKSDVIYIDNRTAGPGDATDKAVSSAAVSSASDTAASPVEDAAALSPDVAQNASRASAQDDPDAGGGSDTACRQGLPEYLQKKDGQQADSLMNGKEETAGEIKTDAAAAETADAQEAAEIQTDIPKKYFSRDCSISRNGKNYTVEELEKQIKE